MSASVRAREKGTMSERVRAEHGREREDHVREREREGVCMCVFGLEVCAGCVWPDHAIERAGVYCVGVGARG
eukprot:1121737-Rhodomonas_salina.1